MREPLKHNLSLSSEDVRAMTLDRLRTYLPLRADGWLVSTDMVLDIMLEAAVTGKTIESVCRDLTGVADANTIRDYLHRGLRPERLDELEDRFNASLVPDVPRRIRRQKQDIACDVHDQAFYGHTPELMAYACRDRARSGTTYFYRVATAYVMHNGLRITLAVAFVRPEDQLPEVLAKLLERVAQLGVTIRRLWLDKGFARTPIYRHLQQTGTPSIIACPIRGKKGGTRALCTGRGSYSTTHTFRSQTYGQCTVPVVVARAYSSSRWRRKPRRATWLLFVQLNSTLRPQRVRQLYRKRFGIESSYRCMRQVRLRTTTRNPAWRFVFMALGFLLVNIWIILRFLHCQIPRRGRSGRPLDEDRFRLDRLASFIHQAVTRRYGVVHEIWATALPIGM